MTDKELNDKIFDIVLDSSPKNEQTKMRTSLTDSAVKFEEDIKLKMIPIEDPSIDEKTSNILTPEEMKAHIAHRARIRSASMGIKSISPRTANQKVVSYFKSPIGIILALLLIVFSLFYIFKTDSKPNAPQLSVLEETKKPADLPVQNLFNVASNSFNEMIVKSFEPTKINDKIEFDKFLKDESVQYVSTNLIPKGGKFTGGFVSEVKGVKLANGIFLNGKLITTILYVPFETLKLGTPVYVTSEVINKLNSGDKIIESINDNHTICMFKTGSDVITAVSDGTVTDVQHMFEK
jgi:hypothetical protein